MNPLFRDARDVDGQGGSSPKDAPHALGVGALTNLFESRGAQPVGMSNPNYGSRPLAPADAADAVTYEAIDPLYSEPAAASSPETLHYMAMTSSQYLKLGSGRPAPVADGGLYSSLTHGASASAADSVYDTAPFGGPNAIASTTYDHLQPSTTYNHLEQETGPHGKEARPAISNEVYEGFDELNADYETYLQVETDAGGDYITVGEVADP